MKKIILALALILPVSLSAQTLIEEWDYVKYLENRLQYSDMLLSAEYEKQFGNDIYAVASLKSVVEQCRDYLKTVVTAEDSANAKAVSLSLDTAIRNLLDNTTEDIQKRYGIEDIVYRGKTSRPVYSREGYWSYEGGRWIVPVLDDNIFRSVENYWEGNHDLPDGRVYLHLGNLPEGDYMLSVCLRGYLMQGTTSLSRFLPDSLSSFYGVKLRLGEVEFDCGSLPHGYYGTYIVFAHLKDSLYAGVEFTLPEEYRGRLLGGRLYVGNPEVRRLWAPVTGVESLETAASRKSQPMFDLQGRRVSGRPQRGVYIRDGRKVMVR